MKGPKGRHVHVGKGDRPAEVVLGGGRPSVGGASGGQADSISRVTKRGRQGHLRYSCQDEADAARREMERKLRLKRLEQVREQSRHHAAAMREEYRQRREQNKQAAVLESKVGRNGHKDVRSCS